mgnify:CR=1 FL=1
MPHLVSKALSLVSLWSLVLLGLSLGQAHADVSGSADPPGLKRFAGSSIIFQSRADFDQLKLALEKLVFDGARGALRPYKHEVVEGRRITDAETLKVVTMVYGGLINKALVSEIVLALGCIPVARYGTPGTPELTEALANRLHGVRLVTGRMVVGLGRDRAEGYALRLDNGTEYHADAVVLGEAEPSWPIFLEDFRAANLKKFYRPGEKADLKGLPIPRRDLLKRGAYFFTNTMQVSRGCPFQCSFCSVTAFFGHTYRLRPLEEVRREVEILLGQNDFIFFVDDNIIGNPAYARDLFSCLQGLKVKWVSHASLNIAENEELLTLAAKSGCHGLFIGFESLSEETLKSHRKTANRVSRYREQIGKIHDRGIGVEGSFIFGSDEEDSSVFGRVVDFCEETKIDAAVFAVLTPYPGTRIYDQYTQEGRIFSRDWDLYDMDHVVFRPKRMTAEELQAGHDWANRRFYSYPSMLRRFWPLRRSHQVFLPSNWGMRRAWKRLQRH